MTAEEREKTQIKFYLSDEKVALLDSLNYHAQQAEKLGGKDLIQLEEDIKEFNKVVSILSKEDLDEVKAALKSQDGEVVFALRKSRHARGATSLLRRAFGAFPRSTLRRKSQDSLLRTQPPNPRVSPLGTFRAAWRSRMRERHAFRPSTFSALLNEASLSSNGIIYGYFDPVRRELHLNSDFADFDTPIHEWTHVWWAWLKGKDPRMIERIAELMKQTKEYQRFRMEAMTDKKSVYHGLSEEELAEEVFARLTGKRGESKNTRSVRERVFLFFSKEKNYFFSSA